MAAMPRPQPCTHPLLHLIASILGKTLGTMLSVLYHLPSVLYFGGNLERRWKIHVFLWTMLLIPEKFSKQRIQVSLRHYLPQAQLERQGMNSCIVCSCGSTTKHYLNFPSEEKDGSSTPGNERFLIHCDGENFLFSSALEFMRAQLSPQAHPG